MVCVRYLSLLSLSLPTIYFEAKFLTETGVANELHGSGCSASAVTGAQVCAVSQSTTWILELRTKSLTCIRQGLHHLRCLPSLSGGFYQVNTL